MPIEWVDALAPEAPQSENRIEGTTVFAGSEGIWYFDDIVGFTCNYGNRVWALNTAENTIELIYDDDAFGGADAPLRGVDNCVVYNASRDLLVAEDGGDMRISAIGPDGVVRAYPADRRSGQLRDHRPRLQPRWHASVFQLPTRGARQGRYHL